MHRPITSHSLKGDKIGYSKQHEAECSMCGVHGLVEAITDFWTTVSAIEWSLSRPTCSFVIQAQQFKHETVS